MELRLEWIAENGSVECGDDRRVQSGAAECGEIRMESGAWGVERQVEPRVKWRVQLKVRTLERGVECVECEVWGIDCRE